ncbi:MAG: UDP-4-amino-4,6-dideoxy-N-acetyl-beta-L-altrosamine transaminase [Rhodothermales bacterium]
MSQADNESDGGHAFIPYGRQIISDDDVAAVEAVLRSDYLTQGPAVGQFEAAVARAVGAERAVAMNSGTSALHVACLALDLGPGGLLWTSPNSFVASANCGLYCGASVDFVDIDPRTYCMSADALSAKLAVAVQPPDVVVPVGFAGQSCDMVRIRALADRYGFKVLEDASHAIGATNGGKPVGSGGLADITVFSFHPVKIVTTAEGGVAVTADAALAGRMERLRSHGITRDEALMDGASHGPWYYQQTELGLNYRMTDMQAALGLSQMSRLAEFVARRRALAARYDALLAPLDVVRPFQMAGQESAWHLYVIQVVASERRRVFEGMRAAGIGVNVHYIPIHLQPYYRGLGFAPGQFEIAEAYYRRAITLPLHAGLTEGEQNRVVETLRGLL